MTGGPVTVWLDGAVVDAAEARVSALDHGLTVGDGVFETLKVVDGVPFALTRHLARLERSAAGMGLAAPPPERVRAAAAELLAAVPLASARLRITVTGGVGPPGSDRGAAAPTLLLAVAPLPAWPATAAVVTVPWPRNERGATAGLKTTSYAENVVALAAARAAEATEALFPNTRGELCEGTGSNVFVVLGGRLLTPPLDSGCLAGITRELVLEWVPGAEEAALPMTALTDAEEVFVTSSTRDVQGVRRIDGRDLDAPGRVTRVAAETFAKRAADEPDP